MIYLLILGSCIVFVELFLFLNPRRQISSLLRNSREAHRVLAAANIGDDEKEIFARGASLAMLRATIGLALKLTVLAGVLYGLYAATAAAFPAVALELSRTLLSPTVVLSSTLAAAGYAWVRHVIVEQL